jgi:hypothetical protein
MTLEGRAVPSHGVGDASHAAETAIVTTTVTTNPVTVAPETVDNHRQRGYPIPPTASPKPPEITARPKPTIILPSDQPAAKGPTATQVAIGGKLAR